MLYIPPSFEKLAKNSYAIGALNRREIQLWSASQE